MAKRPKERRTLEEVLESAAHAIYWDYDLRQTPRVPSVRSRTVDGDTVLHHLVFRGDTYGAKLVIDAGAPLNAKGDLGQTPLHIAVRKENEEIIRYLLKKGAKRNIPNELGETAEDVAQSKNLLRVLKRAES